MPTQRTLCIIKPDAVEKRKQGAILQKLLDEGFQVLAMRQATLTRKQAEGFYAVHRERPFFDELCTFMTRGPVVLLALSADDAVQTLRIFSTPPTIPYLAADGTVRKLYGANVGENAVHGSDSEENGRIECGYYFPGLDLV